MDLQLRDRVAFVAASSKGIGRGVALALSREGCRVVISSSDAARLERTRDEIAQTTGNPVDAVEMDLRSPAAIDTATRKVLASHGAVDVLVTNSPGPPLMRADGLEQAPLEAALHVNCMTVVQLCTAFLPGMIARGFGRIINLTSSTAKEPDADLVLSSMARAAVLAYAKTLSREVARHGVTVNSILTGSVMSDRTMQLFEREAREAGTPYETLVAAAEADLPVGYIATPEQFAETIAFLASPRAAYVTGIALPVDGGLMRAI